MANACAALKASLLMTHDASASSNGTAMYLGWVGGEYKIYSTTANNADTYFDLTVIGTDGVATTEKARVTVYDDNSASSLGVQLFVDEDYADGSKRIIAVVPTLGDAFIRCSNGALLQVRYVAATTSGVAMYVDDNGATSTARTLFVSPTTANATVTTSNERCDFFVAPNA